MWITDKHGHPVNTRWLVSLYVASDGGTGYEVQANTYDPTTGDGQHIASFNTGGSMTQSEAGELLGELARLLGSFDPRS
ncbi:MAG: hypothetical protein ACRDQ0_00330 [Pseudonocardia sp.]